MRKWRLFLMLRNLLKNLSDTDLRGLLTDAQNKVLATLELDNESELDLVNVVYETVGLNLLKEPAIFKKLIQRLSSTQVTSIVEALSKGNTTQNVGRAEYELLVKLYQDRDTRLYSAMGLEYEFNRLKTLTITQQDVYLVDPQYPLHDYQRRCLAQFNKYYYEFSNADERNRKSRLSRCLLHLPTGAGKTRTAMHIACNILRVNPDALVIWLADRNELCSQALMEFNRAWAALGIQSVHAYAYFGSSQLSISGIRSGFFVGSLQKLNRVGQSAKKELFSKLKERTTLVIFDEAHKAIATTYAALVNEFVEKSADGAFLLGLTATPGRLHGFGEKVETENDRLSNFFQNRRITMEVATYSSPLEYLFDQKYLARPKFIPINYNNADKLTFDSGQLDMSNSELYEVLSSNSSRNVKLLDTLNEELHDPGSQIIVFACTRNHSSELAIILAAQGVSCRSVDAETPQDIRAAAIQDYKDRKVRVLFNYGVLVAGFDAPCTNVAVIARPTASLVEYSQMAGRAMRGQKGGGNRECRIYTVNDNIPEFQSVFKAFEYWDQNWRD